MPASPQPREVFVDRGLGRVVVPEALRAQGLTVLTMADVFGDREQFVEDEEWLAVAGQRGWIVLTKDRRIRRRPAEIAAIARHDVRAFVLARGTLTGEEQAAVLVANLPRILAAAEDDGPMVYEVHATRITKLYPKD